MMWGAGKVYKDHEKKLNLKKLPEFIFKLNSFEQIFLGSVANRITFSRLDINFNQKLDWLLGLVKIFQRQGIRHLLIGSYKI